MLVSGLWLGLGLGFRVRVRIKVRVRVSDNIFRTINSCSSISFVILLMSSQNRI